MALEPIRPKDLAPATLVTATGTMIPGDNGAAVERVTPSQIVAAVAPVASQATAIAGVNNTQRMTPLTVKQVLDNATAPSVALAQAWAESATAPNPLDPTSKSSKIWAGEAAGSAAQAAIYDGPRVDSFAALVALTSVNVAVGQFVQVRGLGWFKRLPDASPSELANTASVLKWQVMPQTGELSSGMFGAVGGVTDDRTAVQVMIDNGASKNTKAVISVPTNAAGQLTLASGLELEWRTGAWLKQTANSETGSFVQNLRTSSADVASIMSNINLINPQIDGAAFPAPIELEVLSSTATTLTFTSAASAVDGAYVGLCVEDTTGANASGLRIVTAYVGATRTATHTTAWTANPPATTKVLLGWNDNAIGVAAGVSDITISGGISKNYPANKMVPSATGGKGVTLEQGVTNGKILNKHVENVGTAFFVQGVDGSFANGAKRRTTPIYASGLSAKNVGSALTLAGINTAASPDGDSDDSMIVVDGLTYENAGHSPWRIVSSDNQKSGVINLLEAQNVSLSNIMGRNDATYPNTSPGYPTDYPARCGYGLSGSIGAMIWGHGRNISVNGFTHYGNVDNAIVIRRGRALGDDAGPTGAPRNCFNWNLKNLTHYGVINEYIVRIDPTLAFRVANSELTGEIEIAVNGSFVTLGLVDPNMATFTNITLTLRDHVGLKTVIGTPAQIFAAGNTFASFASGVTDLRVKSVQNASLISGPLYSLANNTALSITPPRPHGILVITSPSSLLQVMVMFRTTATTSCVCVGTEPSNFTAINTDGTLTGLTGAATDFSVRVNSADGKIYFENQRGGTVNFYVTFLG